MFNNNQDALLKEHHLNTVIFFGSMYSTAARDIRFP